LLHLSPSSYISKLSIIFSFRVNCSALKIDHHWLYLQQFLIPCPGFTISISDLLKAWSLLISVIKLQTYIHQAWLL
jgi:hypothetical protein